MISYLLLGYIGCEILSYINYTRLYNYAKKIKEHNCDVNVEWMEDFWLNKISKEELENWMLKTIATVDNFKSVPIENMSQLNKYDIKCWLSSNLYFKSFDKLDDLEIKNIESLIPKLEYKLNNIFESSDVIKKNMIYNFCETNMISCYKPLPIYTSLNIIKNTVYLRMLYHGFTKHYSKHSKFVYFYYNSPKNYSTTIFIHGLGFGITPYLNFILELTKHTNLIVPVLPNISNMEFHSSFSTLSDDELFPSYENWRKDFRNIIKNHGIDDINVIAHSFGTVITGILLKCEKIYSKLNKKILIDPVCFIEDSYKIQSYLNNPDNSDGTLSTKIFNEVIYMDIYVRYIAQRFICGPEFWIMDYNKISDENYLVVLSTNDSIVPTNTIYKTLSEHNIPCIKVQDAVHAQVFCDNNFKEVLDKIIEYIKIDDEDYDCSAMLCEYNYNNY